MCPKIPMLGVWKPSIQVSSKHLFWSDFHLSMPQKDLVSIMQRYLNSSFAYFNATFAASLTRAKSWGFTQTKMKWTSILDFHGQHVFIYEEGMPKTWVSQPACDKLISISQDKFRGSVVLPSVVTQLWESNTSTNSPFFPSAWTSLRVESIEIYHWRSNTLVWRPKTVKLHSCSNFHPMSTTVIYKTHFSSRLTVESRVASLTCIRGREWTSW